MSSLYSNITYIKPFIGYTLLTIVSSLFLYLHFSKINNAKLSILDHTYAYIIIVTLLIILNICYPHIPIIMIIFVAFVLGLYMYRSHLFDNAYGKDIRLKTSVKEEYKQKQNSNVIEEEDQHKNTDLKSSDTDLAGQNNHKIKISENALNLVVQDNTFYEKDLDPIQGNFFDIRGYTADAYFR